MKHGRLFHIAPMIWILLLVLAAMSGVTFFFDVPIACAEATLTAILALVSFVRLFKERRDIDRYMRRVCRSINEADDQAMSMSSLPVAAVMDNGQVLWHNRAFEENVLLGESILGQSASEILGQADIPTLSNTDAFSVDYKDKHYEVRSNRVSLRDRVIYVLYYLDVTDMYKDAQEFAATRPVMLLVYMDNLDELMQHLRESERARLASKVQNALEDWLAGTGCILRKIDDQRFMALIEKRYLEPMVQSRFDILDRVRSFEIDNQLHITLSIGVGEGTNFAKAEMMARQAMDMALGRGGDQAAINTGNGFEFFGGLSKGVERRTKVHTRIMATALRDAILASDNVLVMGHRFSDLDSVGSGLALVSIARALNKEATLIVSRKSTLAEELFVRYDAAGRSDMFTEPSDALSLVRPRTLLIVTDTQNPKLVEAPNFLDQIKSVVVIDHHRKMNDHIDNATLFIHESVASSACEMVTELVQYMDVPSPDVLEAEALLSGIMLDTRNFVLKAGVRTFEAAAYLRKQNADTVSVKKIFAGSMELHRLKAEIMSCVKFYRHTAIAAANSGEGASLRIACSQAADELLSVKDTEASFALFADGGSVNISARSYGGFNVQLVMERLGGGGHLTMAGCQLKDVTMQQAIGMLMEAIDDYYANI